MWDTAPKLVLGYPGLLPCWKAPNALMKHNRKDSAIGEELWQWAWKVRWAWSQVVRQEEDQRLLEGL